MRTRFGNQFGASARIEGLQFMDLYERLRRVCVCLCV